MPRRARHEARHRFHERKRDLRRKHREARRQRFIRAFRYAFEHYGFRVSARGTFFEAFREALLDELKRAFHKSIQDLIREGEEIREKLALLRDIVTGRAKVIFKVRHERIFDWKRNVYIYDRLLLELPEDVRNTIVQALIDTTRGKGVSPRLLELYPILRHFLMLYIAYYTKFPCKHRVYAIKITPVTLHFMKGLRTTYYVIRWAYAKDVKADPYLGRTRNVDFYFSFMRYKYDGDLWNSMVVGGEGTGNYTDEVALARDHFRRATYLMNLRRAIFQTHWVKIALAKMMGKPEMATVVGHCSTYGTVGRYSITLRLLERGQYRIRGVRPRHRIKEMLYYKGLRI